MSNTFFAVSRDKGLGAQTHILSTIFWSDQYHRSTAGYLIVDYVIESSYEPLLFSSEKSSLFLVWLHVCLFTNALSNTSPKRV